MAEKKTGHLTVHTTVNVRRALKEATVAGDYYEFGVWEGQSLWAAYSFVVNEVGDTSMHFWGFDSFQGLPYTESVFNKGDYLCYLETVRRSLTDLGVDWNRIDLIPGWFEESLKSGPTDKMRKAAVVLVDCDIYVSTVPVLEFVSHLLQAGTIVIFDEYTHLGMEQGERRAQLEFSERHPEWIFKPHRDRWGTFIIEAKAP